VFLVNSRHPQFTAPSSRKEEGPFVPKLQGEFAEFLQSGYLISLGLVDLFTCVGLRYGLKLSYGFSLEARCVLLEEIFGFPGKYLSFFLYPKEKKEKISFVPNHPYLNS